jgi:hypothetical protein
MTLNRYVARSLLVCGLILAAAACGSTGRPIAGSDPFANAGAGTPAEIRIRVRNSNFYDAALTAVGDTGRRRLGTVGGNTTAVFTTPWTFTGGLSIQIDLLAGPTCTTQPITVSPGDTVELEIPPDFSTACI